jgi:peptidoglycan/LPS O-acetylase OafA/YrhL
LRFHLDALRRTTNSRHFIPEIDGMRFFAIATVVLFHLNTAYSESLGHDFNWGIEQMGHRWRIWKPGWWWFRLDIGVKVFFSISGFVLALPFLKSRMQGTPEVKLGEYFYRRLTRLEPPFVVSLIAFLLVHVFFLGESLTRLIPHFLAGLVYSHVMVFGYANPINPVTWSLETEAQFYAVVPFLFMAMYALRPPAMRWLLPLALALLSILFRRHAVLHYEEYVRLSQGILVFFVNFSTGILFAWVYLAHPSFLRAKSPLWDLAGLAAIFSMFVCYKPQHNLTNNLGLNLSVLLFMASVFKGPLLNRFFTAPFVYVTGGMCYTIYLLHFPYLFFALQYTKGVSMGLGYLTDVLLQSILVLPTLFLVSCAFFLLFEKPCMDKRWPQMLAERLRRGPKSEKP